MSRHRSLAILFFVLAAVLWPWRASAAATTNAETRVGNFDLVVRTFVEAQTLRNPVNHRAKSLADCNIASGYRLAAEGATVLDASAIRFSQSSVNGVGEIAQSMAAKGWAGAPIDVVRMESGLVTVDNTRLLAAHMTNTPVQAVVRGAGQALPASMAGRFGNATTWGEAVLHRIGNQNTAYRSLFPNGSWAVGVRKP